MHALANWPVVLHVKYSCVILQNNFKSAKGTQTGSEGCMWDYTNESRFCYSEKLENVGSSHTSWEIRHIF